MTIFENDDLKIELNDLNHQIFELVIHDKITKRKWETVELRGNFIVMTDKIKEVTNES